MCRLSQAQDNDCVCVENVAAMEKQLKAANKTENMGKAINMYTQRLTYLYNSSKATTSPKAEADAEQPDKKKPDKKDALLEQAHETRRCNVRSAIGSRVMRRIKSEGKMDEYNDIKGVAAKFPSWIRIRLCGLSP